jgi:glycosyltransferase involved in cell wall biosynthesis
MTIQNIYFDGTFLANRAGIGRDARILLAASKEVFGEDLNVVYPKSRFFKRVTLIDLKRSRYRIPQKILKLRAVAIRKPDYLCLPTGSTFIQPQLTHIIPAPQNNTKHIVRMHDIFPITHPQWFRTYSVRQFQSSFKNLDSSRVAFLFDSEYTMRKVTKFFPYAKALIAYCPVRVNTSEPCKNCQGCELIGDQKQDYVLALGTIEPRKNYDLLVESWTNPDYSFHQFAHLLVVGRYGWKSRTTRRSLRRNSKKGITWLNGTCDFSLNELFGQTKLLVSTSHEEGFNLPVAEATIRNIPTLVSRNHVHAEIYSGTSLFFNQNDVFDFSAKLYDFLSDKCALPDDKRGTQHDFDFDSNFSKLKEALTQVTQ